MHSDTIVHFRPYRPPAQPPTLERDPFHSVIQSCMPLMLSGTTLSKFAEAKARVEEAYKNLNDSDPAAGGNVTIVPLGTGSAIPSKYRNGQCLDSGRSIYTLLIHCFSFWHTPSDSGLGKYTFGGG